MNAAPQPAQHTPGPWFIEDNDVQCVCATSPKGWLRTPENPRYIVVQTGCYTSPPKEVQAANARLIAAAPELLASLKEMDDLIEMLWDAVDWGKTFNLDIAALNEVPMRCKAAIAKASPEC